MPEVHNIYKDQVLSSIPRLLSLMDRNRFSPTYGCLDRGYWHYKAITDYPAAVYQQGILALALLYKNNFEGNDYFGNKQLFEWISGGISFWAGIQKKDGSFDEWYPNEHSYVATAFTSYAISETVLLLKEELPKGLKEKAIGALIKSGAWLARHKDEVVLNHTAGAVAALYNIFKLTDDKRYSEALNQAIKTMIKNQSNEGWFYEYYGADPGYLGLSVDFMAKYYKRSGDDTVLGPLKKALRFMACFVHPDSSYGGEYGSRNNKSLFPHGLEILADRLEEARYILAAFYRGLLGGRSHCLKRLDDRYLVFFFINNYTQAMLDFKARDFIKADTCHSGESVKTFSDAGLVVKINKLFYMVCNYKKSGVFKIFALNNKHPFLVYSDAGYFGKFNNRKIISSQWLNRPMAKNTDFSIKDEGRKIIIKIDCPLIYVNYSVPMRKVLIPFRIFNLTLGMSDSIASRFSVWLKNKMIVKNYFCPLRLERHIFIEDDKISIRDHIYSAKKLKFNLFSIERSSTAMHVPSTRYYEPADLQDACCLDKMDFSETLNRKREFSLYREFLFKEKDIGVRFELDGKVIHSSIIAQNVEKKDNLNRTSV